MIKDIKNELLLNVDITANAKNPIIDEKDLYEALVQYEDYIKNNKEGKEKNEIFST